jgi:peptidoglycan/LPS O-acetylase OafA/YrhL
VAQASAAEYDDHVDDDPTNGVKSGGRLPSLDGLRAVAIAVVVYGHAVATDGFPRWLDWPVHDGSLAVRTFFVLSGFLITRLMLEEADRSGRMSLAGFYRRRAVRILPVLWAYLLFVAVLGWAEGSPLRWWQPLVPLTFTNGFPFWPRAGLPWSLLHTWSLAVEEQFYLVWPAVFAAACAVLPRRLRFRVLMLVLLAVGVAGPVGRAWMYVRPRRVGLIFTFAGNGDMIAWGCGLALVWHAYPSAVRRFFSCRPARGRAAAMIFVLGMPWYVGRTFGVEYVWAAWSVQAAALAYLIGSLVEVRRGVSYRLLNRRPAVWLGLLSYGLYVWQQPFLGGTPGHWWRRWPANLACAIVAACASYWLVERPTRRFRRSRKRPASQDIVRGEPWPESVSV